jgi:hypothetical protein
MTIDQALILLVSLLLIAMVALFCLLLKRSHLLTRDSPTATSTQPTPSDPLVEMMKMMTTMMREENKETRSLMELMMLGRPVPESQETLSTFSKPLPMEFDYDSTPLSPGIEAVMERELEEDQQEVLMRERIALQERMRELQAEEMRLKGHVESADSSPGPWSEPEGRSESPT